MTVQSIVAGPTHACAVTKPNGKVICWGDFSHNRTDVPEEFKDAEVISLVAQTFPLGQSEDLLAVGAAHADAAGGA